MCLQFVFERSDSVLVQLRFKTSQAPVVVESFLLSVPLRSKLELLRSTAKVLSFRSQETDIVMSPGNYHRVKSALGDHRLQGLLVWRSSLGNNTLSRTQLRELILLGEVRGVNEYI